MSSHEDDDLHGQIGTVASVVATRTTETRIFSPRGCHLLAMLSPRPSQAKAFRRWVLDVLESHVRGNGAACRLMPLLGLTRKRWGHVFTPKGFNSVSLNAALVLNYLLEECDDNRWHSLSYREMGEAIGISHTSVYKVLVRLEEWEFIGRKPGSSWKAQPGPRLLPQDSPAAETRQPGF